VAQEACRQRGSPPQSGAAIATSSSAGQSTLTSRRPALCSGPVEAQERIARASSVLTSAERRVAEVILQRPQLVAFGTVAELAEAAGSGAATVVRLASKLDYDGFTALQASIQRDLASQLRPAVERIREARSSTGDLVERHGDIEIGNISATLESLDRAALDEVVGRLTRPSGRVAVLSGNASMGIAVQFVSDLLALRPHVSLVDGNDVAVRRQVAVLDEGDTLVTIDVRRYDRWVVDAARLASASGVWQLAIADSVLSPLASTAARTLVVSAASAGPFDSHVGTLSLLNLLVIAVADALRATATERLDRIEAAWRDGESLIIPR
jgi:DNA-binding MurR/RpiR family transcriptional regulator